MNESYFSSYGWKLYLSDGRVICPSLKLYLGGSIGVYVNANERLWEIDGEQLRLKNISGVTTSSFVVLESDEVGVRRLVSSSSLGKPLQLLMERTVMPSLADVEAATMPSAELEVLQPARKRRNNLVFVSAGPGTVHYDWARYLSDEDRNWDLCTSWYGKERPEGRLPGEYFMHLPGCHKMSAFSSALMTHPHLHGYDAFWVPDDDIETTWRDINRMFNIFRRLDMSLAQPALRSSSDCYINHAITLQDTKYLVRYTTFVEIMCPLISREMAMACLQAFRGLGRSYYIDYVMMNIEGRIPSKAGIIDDVAVTHGRATAATYDATEVTERGKKLVQLYPNTSDKIQVIGGLLKEHAFF